jgi:hypothetical protein
MRKVISASRLTKLYSPSSLEGIHTHSPNKAKTKNKMETKKIILLSVSILNLVGQILNLALLANSNLNLSMALSIISLIISFAVGAVAIAAVGAVAIAIAVAAVGAGAVAVAAVGAVAVAVAIAAVGAVVVGVAIAAVGALCSDCQSKKLNTETAIPPNPKGII